MLFSVSACGNNVDSYTDLILPGKDRLLWDVSFNDIDEIKDFIIKLKMLRKIVISTLEFVILKPL